MSEQTSKQRLATYTKRIASAFKSDDSISANDLATIVERDAKTVRAHLRKAHTRNADAKNSTWTVDQATAQSVAEHFASAAKRTSA